MKYKHSSNGIRSLPLLDLAKKKSAIWLIGVVVLVLINLTSDLDAQSDIETITLTNVGPLSQVAVTDEVATGYERIILGKSIDKPNIIFILADDAGYADFGFQPNSDENISVVTPNIDSIAKSGVRFSNAYMSASVCSPSRAGLMTGRYQQSFGHEMNFPANYRGGGLDTKQDTMADYLARLGYLTGIIGKWHLGYDNQYHPNQRGFDFFYGMLQGSRSYFPITSQNEQRALKINGEKIAEGGYLTDRIADGAVDFIEENAHSPFFLFVSFTAPHAPLEAKEDDVLELEHIIDEKRRTYTAMVKSLDDNVGKILNSLERQKLENTLIVFTNDNGGQTVKMSASNAPLKGQKGELWEGGIRVPLAIRWDGHISPGLEVTEPVISLDILPTFLGAVGVEEDLDGINLLSLLNGQTGEAKQRTLFWRQGGARGWHAARKGPWKLIQNGPGGDYMLFDLSKDIKESFNVAHQNRDIEADLLVQIKQWEANFPEPSWGMENRGRK